MAQKVPHTFTVNGRGAFPLDMLRYDRAWPADGDAVDAISIAFNDPDARAIRRVTLRTSDELNVTPARWGSFGWPVIAA